MRIKRTTAQSKIESLRKPIRIIQGGQGASKTFSILCVLITYAQSRPDTTITIFQYELSKARKTVIRDFIFIMRECGFFNRDNWTGGVFYQFENGSYIEFSGLDDKEIGKGFRRDIVYFNEANRGITFETYNQVASRSKIVYIDFNPDRNFWCHLEVMKQDHDFLILTFQDNEALSDAERNNILDYKRKGETSPYWANKWRVYGLGLVGKLDGQIYDWEVIDEVPKEAELIRYGLDFGFNDPTVLEALYKWNDGYIVDEMMYRNKLDASEYQQVFNGLNLNKNIVINADGSRPELIKAIERIGLRIKSVNKSDKVDRIMLLSSIKIYVTKRSINTIREKDNYVWQPNDTGLKDVPIQYDDHCMDSVLYSADEVIIRPKAKSNYYIY